MSKRNRDKGRRTGSQALPTVGKTEDSKLVVSGTYDFHETCGFPLEMLFAYLSDRNIVPDWVDFYKCAARNGMKHDRILSKIKDPIEDAYGVDFAKVVCDTLTELFIVTTKTTI